MAKAHPVSRLSPPPPPPFFPTLPSPSGACRIRPRKYGLSVDNNHPSIPIRPSRPLTPIWTSKPELACKVRQRIRATLEWAMAHGHVDRNMAEEAIDRALPAMPAVAKHFRALPYGEVGHALELIEASRASLSAKACLRFLALTACRSGETRGASWEEVDLESREWRIPAARRQAEAEHRVPLSGAALAAVESVRPLRDRSGLLFPSPQRAGRPLSDMTLTNVLRDTGLADRATVHGFRTPFRTWASERTSVPHAVAEMALARAVGEQRRAELRQVGPVRQAPRADGAVGATAAQRWCTSVDDATRRRAWVERNPAEADYGVPLHILRGWRRRVVETPAVPMLVGVVSRRTASPWPGQTGVDRACSQPRPTAPAAARTPANAAVAAAGGGLALVSRLGMVHEIKNSSLRKPSPVDPWT